MTETKRSEIEDATLAVEEKMEVDENSDEEKVEEPSEPHPTEVMLPQRRIYDWV